MSYSYPESSAYQRGTEFITKSVHDTYPAINPTNLTSLVGKFVFITGASKGIGLATAISYAKAGAKRIAIGARGDLSSLIPTIQSAAQEAGHKSPPEVLVLKLDVQDPSSVAACAEKLTLEFSGKLDVLINNAGYLEDFRKIAETDPEEYWRTWEINYRGVYLVTRSVLPLLLNNTDGLQTVINVGSVGGLNTRWGASAYQTTKFAIMRFSEFLCVEYADKGLVAYTVHPGGVMTDLGGKMPKELHHVLSDTPELGADTMVFLSSEKRTWLAGRYVSSNWDMTELISKKYEIVQGDKLKMRMTF